VFFRSLGGVGILNGERGPVLSMRITLEIWWESNNDKVSGVAVEVLLVGFGGVRRCSTEERAMDGVLAEY
jgi:hypothetical protein